MEEMKTLTIGGTAYEIVDHQAREALAKLTATARIAEIELFSENWVGSKIPYSQVVTIPGITKYSKVILTPSVEQLVAFYDKDLTLVTENDDGVVTVYAIGQKPSNDYTVQVTIQEVSV